VFEPYAEGDEAAWLASFSFSVEVRPRYYECDAQGHVSNVVYPAYLELSRLRYFAAVNDPEASASFAFRHVTAEIELRYIAACYYDEALTVASKLTSIGRSSAVMEQAITGDGTLRAVARMTVVRANPVGDGSAPWTEAQRAALGRFARIAPDA